MRRSVRQAFLFLAVLASLCVSCADESAQSSAPDEPMWLAQRHENSYAYARETLASFRRLVQGEGWRDPRWNEQGTLEVVHEMTGLVFVLVPTGEFSMGSPDDEAGRGEDEVLRSETVTAFLLSKTEATEIAWLTVRTAPSETSVGTLLPARWMDWYLAKGWCEDAGLRLPTKREWEFACRAGTSTAYCFGNDPKELERYAWFGSQGDREVHEVAGKQANAWGFYDMHGNVAEWCHDRHGQTAYWRVLRGGWMWTTAENCRSAARDGTIPTHGHDWIGFRPAADLPK